jgi:hypothetical protein
MKFKEALQILEDQNDWNIGKENAIKPDIKQTIRAINIAIEFLKIKVMADDLMDKLR